MFVVYPWSGIVGQVQTGSCFLAIACAYAGVALTELKPEGVYEAEAVGQRYKPKPHSCSGCCERRPGMKNAAGLLPPREPGKS